jgi:hypothetical protein
MTKGYVALRATFRSRDRVAMLFRALLPQSQTGRPGIKVALQEMVKIDILCRAQSGRLTADHTFQARPYLLPNGVLELRSAAPDERDSDSTQGSEVLEALHNGKVVSLVWNHSRIADIVYHAWWRNHWVAVWVGPGGRCEFRSITSLLQSDRESAIRIIRPTLLEPRIPMAAQALPNVIATKPRASIFPNHARRLARDPMGYMARVWVIARVISSSHGYRSVIRRYLIDPRLRSLASIDAVLGDLLRLDVLRRLCAPPNRLNVHLHRDLDNGQWSYISAHHDSCPSDQHENVSVEAPLRVTWDHSAVSNSLLIPVGSGPALKVSLGVAGVYEFGAMQRIAQLEPTLVRSILPAPAPTSLS